MKEKQLILFLFCSKILSGNECKIYNIQCKITAG